MTSQLVYLAVAMALVALVAQRLVRRSRSRETLPLPPGPPPLPVIGNLHQAPKSHAWFQYYDWSKEYGPIVHVNMAGQPIIILSSIKVAQDLIARRGAKYSDRPRLVVAGELAMKGMHIMLRNNDEQLRLHQKLQAPFLTPAASTAYLPIQDLESRQLLSDLLTKGESPEGVDFHHEFERTVASTVYALTYGTRLRTASAPQLVNARHVQEALARFLAVGAYIVDSLPFLQDLPLPRSMTPWKDEAEGNYREQHRLHVGNMRGGLATSKGGGEKESSGGWNFSKAFGSRKEATSMSEEELAFDLGILADAALDTTTMTLDWFVVAWVTQEEETRKRNGGKEGFVARAQRNLDEVVGRDRLPGFQDKGKLPYIDAIVEEVLRWRPIVGAGVAHAIRSEDTYEGYRIPAGSIVLPNHWALTRDVDVFGENVEEFEPERWLVYGEKEGEVVGIKDFGSPVFGYGRRICPGRHIARNSLWIQLARMLWAFKASPGMVPGSDKKRHVVDDMAGTDALLTKPLPFNVQFLPRGPWVTELLERECKDAVDTDPAEILAQIGKTKGLGDM